MLKRFPGTEMTERSLIERRGKNQHCYKWGRWLIRFGSWRERRLSPHPFLSSYPKRNKRKTALFSLDLLLIEIFHLWTDVNCKTYLRFTFLSRKTSCPELFAKVGNRILAETESGKTVENNIYVRLTRLNRLTFTDFIINSFPAQQSLMISVCKTPIGRLFALGKATPLTGIWWWTGRLWKMQPGITGNPTMQRLISRIMLLSVSHRPVMSLWPQFLVVSHTPLRMNR